MPSTSLDKPSNTRYGHPFHPELVLLVRVGEHGAILSPKASLAHSQSARLRPQAGNEFDARCHGGLQSQSRGLRAETPPDVVFSLAQPPPRYGCTVRDADHPHNRFDIRCVCARQRNEMPAPPRVPAIHLRRTKDAETVSLCLDCRN